MRFTMTLARLGRAAALLDLAIVLVLAIHLAGGPAVGFDDLATRGIRDPMALLGTELDTNGCAQAALEVGDGFVLYCHDWSAIASPDGTAQVVSLYGPDHPVVHRFRGELPQGLRWGDTIAQVMDDLGTPYRITDAYGTPTLIYMFSDERYGSLELRFNAAERLDAVNACLTH